MKKIFETFRDKIINEGYKIKVKRKYTEAYPDKYVGYDAKVRNEIISYLGSNQVMTEDEFEDLLNKSAKHPKLWKERNNGIYRKDEQGYIKLTDKGQRIFKGLQPKEISENENDNVSEYDESNYRLSPEYFAETYINGQFSQLRDLLKGFKKKKMIPELIDELKELGYPEIIEWISKNQ
jgi:hypothetical protein